MYITVKKDYKSNAWNKTNSSEKKISANLETAVGTEIGHILGYKIWKDKGTKFVKLLAVTFTKDNYMAKKIRFPSLIYQVGYH